MTLLLLTRSPAAAVTISGSANQRIGVDELVDDDGAEIFDALGRQVVIDGSSILMDVTAFVNPTTPFTADADQTIGAVTQEAAADIILFGVAAQTIDAVTQDASSIKPRSAISRAVIPAVTVHFVHATVTRPGGNSGVSRSTTKTKTPKKEMVPLHRIDRRDLVEAHKQQYLATDMLMSEAAQIAQSIRRNQVEKRDLQAVMDFLERV